MNDVSMLEKNAMNIINNIGEVESLMLKEKQVECSVNHRFGPGVYIREVNIPAGTLAIGHHQNFDHMNIFLKGRVTMVNEDGSLTELVAPMIFVGKPGRKIGYINEDMTWLNVYPTEEKDIEKLEAKYVTKSDGWIESVGYQKKIKAAQAIAELQTKEKTSLISKNHDHGERKVNFIELPGESYKIKLGNFLNNEKAVFATATIEPGEFIGEVTVDGKSTMLDFYVQHSEKPNAKLVKTPGLNINLVAIEKINGCKGGLDGDMITIDYRQVNKLKLLSRGGL